MGRGPDDSRLSADDIALVGRFLELQGVDRDGHEDIVSILAGSHTGGRVHNRHQSAAEQRVESIRIAWKNLIEKYDGVGSRRFRHLARSAQRVPPP